MIPHRGDGGSALSGSSFSNAATARWTTPSAGPVGYRFDPQPFRFRTLIRQGKITPLDADVWTICWQYRRTDGTTRCSLCTREKLATELGVSIHMIKRSFRRLKAAGELVHVQDTSDPTGYRFEFPGVQADRLAPRGGRTGAPPGGAPAHPPPSLQEGTRAHRSETVPPGENHTVERLASLEGSNGLNGGANPDGGSSLEACIQTIALPAPAATLPPVSAPQDTIRRPPPVWSRDKQRDLGAILSQIRPDTRDGELSILVLKFTRLIQDEHSSHFWFGVFKADRAGRIPKDCLRDPLPLPLKGDARKVLAARVNKFAWRKAENASGFWRRRRDQEGKSREDGIEMSNNVLQTSMQAPSRVKPTNGNP
jgi:hypothetical protein